MASIDKSKFQFVKRDDFASETIDAPSYSILEISDASIFKKEINSCNVGNLDYYYFNEFHLPNVF